jgi:hypothetical protein
VQAVATHVDKLAGSRVGAPVERRGDRLIGRAAGGKGNQGDE